MRVIQAIAGAPNGGAEAFYARLVPALARAGLDQLALIRPYPDRRHILDQAGVPWVGLPFGNPYLDLVSRWRFRQLIHRYQPDLVLTWANRPSMMCPASPVGGRRFLRIGRLGGYYDLKYYRGFDHLVGNTPGICDYLKREGFPAAAVHHVPNFVDPPAGPAVDRASIGTPAGVPLVVALGRLHVNKAFDTLLKAIARVPQVHLWLAGAGPEEAGLRQMHQALGLGERVKFLGWRKDSAELLAAADIFICPSRHEPFGNVVAEAWAAGRPVIAAAASGPARIIEHERNGLLVPIDDDGAMADALFRLLQQPDLAARIAAAGHASYQADFAEPSVVGHWLDFFKKVLAEQKTVAERKS